jgi:hypothetical protein
MKIYTFKIALKLKNQKKKKKKKKKKTNSIHLHHFQVYHYSKKKPNLKQKPPFAMEGEIRKLILHIKNQKN